MMETLSQLFYAHLWQGLLLLPMVFILLKILAKRDSALRHQIWATTLGLLILLPFMTLIELPRYTSDWRIPETKQITVDNKIISNEASISIEVPLNSSSVQNTTPFTHEDKANLSNFISYLPPLLLIVWMLGFLVKSRLIVRDYKECAKLQNLEDLTELPREQMPQKWPLGTKVMLSDKIKTPMMVGWFDPIVLIPRAFLRSMSDQQLWSILFHELAHIERRDQWTALLQQITMAILWWSPWAWVASNGVRRERELACDDIAVVRTGNPQFYAKSLLSGSEQVARAHIDRLTTSLAPGVFHRQHELKERIMRLMNSSYIPADKLKRSFSALAMSILTVGMAAISFATPGADLDINSDVIKEVVSRNTNNPVQEAFVDAGARSNPDDLAKFMNAGADINGIHWGDGTALMTAIRSENMENIHYLLENGADANVPVRGDGNALIIAAKKGRLDIIDLLVQSGANINQSVRGDGNAMIIAARNNRQDIIDYLIANGGDINTPSRGDGNALIAAASDGDPDLVSKILSLGADIDMVVPGDETALITAARRNKFEAVQVLIDAGADPNLGVLEDDRCRTPLNVSNNNARIRNYLMENGATAVECL